MVSNVKGYCNAYAYVAWPPPNIDTATMVALKKKITVFVFFFIFSCTAISDEESIKSIGVTSSARLYLDIGVKPMGEALLELSSKSGVIVVVPSEMLEGYKSKPIVGRFSVSGALTGLLAGSPFGFHFDPENQSIKIFKKQYVLSEHSPSQKERDHLLEIEEVIVRARLRDEKASLVPISLDYYTGSDLSDYNLTSLENIGVLSSNTILRVPRGSNSAISAYIRGLGQDDPLAGFETGVGIYIDGVYLNRPQTPVMDIFNLERVEVLKGPQGTLYGRNTIGGAINYVTKAIEDRPASSLELSYGSFNQRDIILTGSTPIEGAATKIGGNFASFQRGGFGRNLLTGQENSDKDIQAARFNIEIDPISSIIINLSSDFTSDSSNPRSGYRLIERDSYPLLDSRYDTQAGLNQEFHPVNDNHVFSRGYSGSLKWEINKNFEFESISAIRSDRVESAIDFNALPDNNLDVHVKYENTQKSQEFRLSWAQGNFYVLSGYYYLNARALSAFDTEIENLSSFSGVSFALSDIETISNSIFFSATYEYSAEIKTSLGLRRAIDSNKASIERAIYTLSSDGDFVSPYFGGNGFLITPTVVDGEGKEVSPKFKGQREDSSVIPRFSVSWQPEDNHHYYFSYSEGYKSGNFDPRGDYTQEGARVGFAPERLDAYELGAKWYTLDNKISVSSAVFSGHYKDIQIPGARGGLASSGEQARYVRNSAEADIDGFELSIDTKFSKHWNFSADFGVLSAKYSKYIAPNDIDEADSRKLPNAPKRSLSLSVDRSIHLGRIGEISAYLSYIYRSDISLVSEAPSSLFVDNYNLTNVGLTWMSSQKKYSFGMHVKNIFDEEYLTDGYYYPEFNTISGFYGDPRTFVIQTKVSTW